MKRLLFIITGLLLLFSLEGQILRYSNYTTPEEPEGGDGALLVDLISYWSLDETSGTYPDSHGSNDGTRAYGIMGESGKVSYCFNSDDLANTGYVNIPYNSSLNITGGELSISAWINLSSFDANNSGTDPSPILSRRYDDTYVPYQFMVDVTGHLIFKVYSGGYLTVTSTRTLNINTWYHVVVTVDVANSQTIFYINGVDETAQSGVTSIPSGTSALDICYYESGGYYSKGLFDEIGIWNKILSQDDVNALYNSGNGLGYSSF